MQVAYWAPDDNEGTVADRAGHGPAGDVNGAQGITATTISKSAT